MNLENKAVRQTLILLTGLVIVGGIAGFAGVSKDAKEALSQQTTTEGTEVAGRTAGVILSLNELEEQTLEELEKAEYEQMNAAVVTASDEDAEALAEEAVVEEVVEEGPVLTEEEKIWQNRLMADVSDKMNVRAEAGKDSEVVGYLRKGDVAEVVEIGEEWTHITSGNVDGYVKNSYCIYGLDALAYAKANVDTRATVTGSGVRLRDAASTDGGVVTAATKGMLLIVDVEAETTDGWTPVKYIGKTRYISSDYVDVEFAVGEAVTVAEAQEAAAIMASEKARRRTEQYYETTPIQNQSYDATTSEIMLMAATIQCEAGGECYEGQVAVGAVILNRVRSSKYPNSISQVIYAPAQFTPASNGKVDNLLASGGVRQSCIRAAQEAVNGVDPTGGCVSFRQTRSGHSGFVIGGHVFFN